jgi:YtkA-like protein
MKKMMLIASIMAAALLVAACSKGSSTGKVIKTAPAGNNLTASLATRDGVFKHGKTDFTLTFEDAAGKPVDVGAVALTFHMPQMGTMSAMNAPATFTTTETPGVYRGNASLEMTGEWHAQVTYEGPVGSGKASFSITAQ